MAINTTISAPEPLYLHDLVIAYAVNFMLLKADVPPLMYKIYWNSRLDFPGYLPARIRAILM